MSEETSANIGAVSETGNPEGLQKSVVLGEASSERPYVWPKIRFALFAYGGVEPRTHLSVIQELSWAQHRHVPVTYTPVSGSALIDKARSYVASDFLLNGTEDVLFMIDHDMGWDPGDASHTARLAFENNAIVGGFYPKRGMNKGWACSNDEPMAIKLGGNEHKLQKCTRLATGFIAIPRKCLNRIVDVLSCGSPEFTKAWNNSKSFDVGADLVQMSIDKCFDPAKKDGKFMYDFFRCCRIRDKNGIRAYYSEDFSFCWRAKTAGVPLYANMKPMITHTGSHEFTHRDQANAPGTAQGNGAGSTAIPQ